MHSLRHHLFDKQRFGPRQMKRQKNLYLRMKIHNEDKFDNFSFFSCTPHPIQPDIPQATLQTTLPPTTTTMITTTSVHRNENMIGKHLMYEREL